MSCSCLLKLYIPLNYKAAAKQHPNGMYRIVEKLQGQALRDQIAIWLAAGIIEPSHAEALNAAVAHPEWFDLSDRNMVLFGAASEAGPLTWLAKWKANIIAVDLPNSRVWNKILNTVQQGNATLYAPSTTQIAADSSI